MNKNLILQENIKSKIYTIRGLQVMLDRDLACFYKVETKVLNQAVRRNINRFPNTFMFQLTKKEILILRSQFVTANISSKSRSFPFVFTEHGVSQLASILKSDIAVEISIKIINTFVTMRKFITAYGQVFQKLDYIERKQLIYEQKHIEYDKKIEQVFNALESREDIPKQGIFFNGQIFDAYNFVIDLIKKAEKSIVLIDNYVDESVLIMLDQRSKKILANIFTKEISEKLKLSLEKHNQQYLPIKIHETKDFHDRFLIIDNDEIYHIGASIKDLGKKCFAFSKIDSKEIITAVLKRLRI
jgi:hypothetical protein